MRKLKHGPVENFLGVTSPIRQICMSPCEKYLVSASHDGAIRVWVIDEREYIDADIETCRRTIDKLEKKRAQFDDKLAEGDDVDENEVKDCVLLEEIYSFSFRHLRCSLGNYLTETSFFQQVMELEKAYARGITVSSAEQERYAMNCVQARMGLDGHTLPVTSIAWRDDPTDPSRVQILSGSQDQSALLFDIKKPNPYHYTKWGTATGGDDSPARKGGYGG